MLVKNLRLTLLFIVTWAAYAQTQPIYAPTSTNNGYRYRFEIAKAAINVPDTVKDFRFFWHFGDEQYHLSPILSFPNSSTIGHTVFHNPLEGPINTNNVYVEITPLTYTDNIEPEREVFPNQISLDTCYTCPGTIVNPNRQVDLLFNRNLVKGHRVTLIVPYRRCDGDVSPTGQETITLYYAADEMMLENSNTLIHGEGVTSPAMPLPEQSFGSPPNIRKLEFAVNPKSRTQNLYIPMRVRNNVNPPQAMDIRLTYDFDANCRQGEKTYRDSGAIDPGVMLAFSHDPNSLSSPTVFTCDCEQQDTIRYVVKFQNVGMATADTVYIKDIIPDAYDINSINVVYPKNGLALPPQSIDYASREVIWTLAGDFLRGPADLLGTASGAPEEQTIDSLVFGIQIAECDSIKSCDAIFNQAEIIFDCNPPLYTNPHLVRFGCKTVDSLGVLGPMPIDSCACNEIILPRDTLVLSASDSTTNYTDAMMTQSLINDFNAVHRWYPTYQVFTPGSPDSKIFTPKTRSFFQLLSTTAQDVDFDCHRVIQETVVKVDCSLQNIEYELTCHKQTGQKDLKAWVPGNTMPLLWRGVPCQTTVEFKENDVQGTEMWLTALDPATNCAVDRWVDLTDCPKRKCGIVRWWQGVFSSE